MNEAIDMSGRVIGHLQVLDQAHSNGRRAMWWVRCSDCRHEFLAAGTNLRKAEAGRWKILCPGCEGTVVHE